MTRGEHRRDPPCPSRNGTRHNHVVDQQARLEGFDVFGNPPQLTAGSFIAGNPAMHAWLLQTVKRANMSKGKTE